jgi:hypothetical protein
VASEPEVRLPVSVPVETNAADEARSVDALADSFLRSQDRIRELIQQKRLLIGKTDEVKRARDELTAAIAKERQAISTNALAAMKEGQNLAKLAEEKRRGVKASNEAADAAKKEAAARAAADRAISEAHAARMKGLSSVVAGVGGPAQALRVRLDAVRNALGGVRGGSDLAKLAVVGMTAAVAALAVAAAAGAAALAGMFARWAFAGANAARTAGLVREAVMGSAEQSRALGSQLDALTRKTSLSADKLQDMGVSLARTRLGGQTYVDTLNAMAQATDALGDDAGAKIRGIVERGQYTGRMSLGFRELDDTGISRDDVARKLAGNLGMGIEDARRELAMGRVKLADGAKALRDAVEEKFGGVNAKKMLDLDVQAGRLKEKLGKLTSGIDLEPMLKGVERIITLFDESTATGGAIKTMVTLVGDGLAKAVGSSASLVEDLFDDLTIAALDLGIAFYKARNYIRDSFGDQLEAVKRLVEVDEVMKVARGSAYLFVGAAGVVVTTLGLAGAAAWKASEGIRNFIAAVDEGVSAIRKGDWVDLGKSVIKGFIQGIGSMIPGVGPAMRAIGDAAEFALKDKLKIKSPSRVFAELGGHTAEGFAAGVESSAPAAAAATASMADAATSGASGAQAPAGRAGGVVVNVSINVGGGGEGAARALSEPNIMRQLTDAIIDALTGAGLPVTP